MKLTGKALQDFIKWSSTGNGYIYVNKSTTTAIHYTLLTDDLLNALIIDWFGSVGIHISTMSDFDQEDTDNLVFFSYIRGLSKFTPTKSSLSRTEAQIEAIKRAAKMYNENPKLWSTKH